MAYELFWNSFVIASSLHFLLFKKYFPILDFRTKSKIDNQDTENIMNTLSSIQTNCSRTRTDRNWWDFLRAGKNLETSSYMYFFMWENRWLDTKTLIRLATFFSSSILSYTWYVGDSHSDKGESYDEMMRKTDRKQSNGIYWALSKMMFIYILLILLKVQVQGQTIHRPSWRIQW